MFHTRAENLYRLFYSIDLAKRKTIDEIHPMYANFLCGIYLLYQEQKVSTHLYPHRILKLNKIEPRVMHITKVLLVTFKRMLIKVTIFEL